ncbi:MAG: peroxiredoxin [Alphaproteobacteria bacterium]|nr:peroxiredoxin [Alphaproteobacteria bacterium]MCB9694846.1 peroxiredoxin [Alphaproteobacteria bacterium]
MSIIGNKAPHFAGEAAKDGEIVEISLDQYAGKWLVLFFYPLDFTFVCPTELVAFSDRAEDFKAIGAEILGVSVDSVHTHLAWMRTPRNQAGVGDLAYPLLSDINKTVCSDYDVLLDGVALRGVFLIDPDGMVQSATVNNLPVGRNVDEVLRTVQAYQYVREHGGTCPANWHQGDAGMDATLDGVKKVIG